MDKVELKKQLNAIIGDIEENSIEVWEHSLEDTKSVVILEDFSTSSGYGKGEDYEYNGWLEKLKKIYKKL